MLAPRTARGPARAAGASTGSRLAGRGPGSRGGLRSGPGTVGEQIDGVPVSAATLGQELEEGVVRVLVEELRKVARHRLLKEEVVHEGLLSRGPLCGVQREQLVNEIEGLGWERRQNEQCRRLGTFLTRSHLRVMNIHLQALLHAPTDIVRQRELPVELQFGDTWPHRRRDRAAQVDDQIQLFRLGVALTESVDMRERSLGAG